MSGSWSESRRREGECVSSPVDMRPTQRPARDRIKLNPRVVRGPRQRQPQLPDHLALPSNDRSPLHSKASKPSLLMTLVTLHLLTKTDGYGPFGGWRLHFAMQVSGDGSSNIRDSDTAHLSLRLTGFRTFQRPSGVQAGRHGKLLASLKPRILSRTTAPGVDGL